MFRRSKTPDPPPEFAVEAINLDRTYGEGEKAARVLRGLNLSVKAGMLVALYGPSGSGKTTLLNLIGALDRPTAGQICLYGKDISKMSDGARAQLRRP